jgi:hypothetical protein
MFSPQREDPWPRPVHEGAGDEQRSGGRGLQKLLEDGRVVPVGVCDEVDVAVLRALPEGTAGHCKPTPPCTPIGDSSKKVTVRT